MGWGVHPRAARDRRAGRSLLARLRIPALAEPLQRVEIGLPAGILVPAELVEIFPAVDAGVVQVVEHETHGVIANRLDLHDADMAAAGDHGLLAGAVTLHLGRRALDAQQLGGQAEAAA